MVDAGGRGAAVHAAPAVPGEERPPGQGDGPPVGDPYEPLQPDDAGRGHGTGGTVQERAGLLKADRLVLQDEDERAVERYDAERLVRRVENQDVRHGGCLLVRRRRVARAGTIRSQSLLMPGPNATTCR
ncbi:hypothetical protein Sfulv_20290 [Streptomyces fulvorobeus]|uniref:Uncharacterized protein n=1 Tax=Streptomyces fulvorobeus TaxID=284028 RepID=A0A7J0C499_9ACTN|nr:hypothetical protein Sfulv_20290 [Streptomyces fulvorobeus]